MRIWFVVELFSCIRWSGHEVADLWEEAEEAACFVLEESRFDCLLQYQMPWYALHFQLRYYYRMEFGLVSFIHWNTQPGSVRKGQPRLDTCADVHRALYLGRITEANLNYILEHVVVSDWMAVACEHCAPKRKLQFERSQQLTLCEYDFGDSGEHWETKRSYRTIHILRRIEITLVREFMNNLAIFIYYLLLGVLLHIRSHFLWSKRAFEVLPFP